MEAQIVFYINDEERDRLIDESIFLLHKVYGEGVNFKQIASQCPHVVKLVQLLVSFSPKEVIDNEFTKK